MRLFFQPKLCCMFVFYGWGISTWIILLLSCVIDFLCRMRDITSKIVYWFIILCFLKKARPPCPKQNIFNLFAKAYTESNKYFSKINTYNCAKKMNYSIYLLIFMYYCFQNLKNVHKLVLVLNQLQPKIACSCLIKQLFLLLKPRH